MGKTKRLPEDIRQDKTPKKQPDISKGQKSFKTHTEFESATSKTSNSFTQNSADSDSEDEDATPEQDDVRSYIKSLPTAENIKGMFRDLTDTLKSELMEIRSDIRQILSRINSVEETTEKIIAHSSALENKVLAQQRELQDLRLHIDDLENRSRRNNLRIKGMPESVEDKDIHTALNSIFSELIGKEDSQNLGIERAHRVYRPKGNTSDMPRDILCYLLSFSLKEEILKKARLAKSINYDGGDITIYQDISKFTLDKRRQLTPFTRALRDRGIKYRWLYPFGLLATYNNRPYIVKTPDDLATTIRKLNLGHLDIPDWLNENSSDQLPALPRENSWQTNSTPKQRRSASQDSPFPRAPRKNQRGFTPR